MVRFRVGDARRLSREQRPDYGASAIMPGRGGHIFSMTFVILLCCLSSSTDADAAVGAPVAPVENNVGAVDPPDQAAAAAVVVPAVKSAGAASPPPGSGGTAVAKPGGELEDDAFLRSLQVSQGFIHAFVASLSVIIVSELGDKTFFIAAIMAMKHARSTVFAGAIAALGIMTLLSALGGTLVTTIIPRAYTYYLSAFLFFVFGVKMLKEGYDMAPDEGQEEYEEVSADLRRREEEADKEKDPELGGGGGSMASTASGFTRVLRRFFPRIFLQSLTLTFLAEWGDRSQIATIVLAAREDMAGVVIGGTLGHALCTGLAVIGGRMIAQRISVRTVTLVGGVVFIFFALSAFLINPDSDSESDV